MFKRILERARDTAPTLASAIVAHVATLSPWDHWLPALQVVDDLGDALARRGDLDDSQLEVARRFCLEALRSDLSLQHLGALCVCEYCGVPAVDEDAEQPDACWDGTCSNPELQARIAQLEATNG
jgi:hypothetical protein